MAGPAATIGSMHTCPMVTGYVPHVGGPVTGPGAPGVTVNGVPVSIVGDVCTCVGPPDTITQGCPGVTINGTPVAIVSSMTAHGGVITVGSPGVKVGPISSSAASGGGGQTANSDESENEIEETTAETQAAEQRPFIVGAEFFDEESDKRIYHGKMTMTVKMRVFTKNFPVGETLTISLKRSQIRDEDGVKQDDEDVITLSGTVNGDVAIVEHEIPDYNNQSE